MALPTSETASGSSPGIAWPTPSANLFECAPEVWKARREKHKARGINGNGFGLTLSMAVQEAELIERGLWPTPQAADGNGGRIDRRETVKSGRRPSGAKASISLREAITYHDTDPQPGPLNPEFVTWLMGFPANWTEA